VCGQTIIKHPPDIIQPDEPRHFLSSLCEL
jgi:hypothetical protein